MNITVSRNDAEFEGVIVPRPSHICPSHWFAIWREVEQDYVDGWKEGWKRGYEEGRDDVEKSL